MASLAAFDPNFYENPWLVLLLAILVAFAIYLILRPARKAQDEVNEEIADVQQAASEGFSASEQVFPPSADFVSKARV
ncbi:MAG: hypothetical protein RIR91_1837, partial [Verrucomicrobiota bacterium]